MTRILKIFCFLGLIVSTSVADPNNNNDSKSEGYNVLFISIDDLRPELPLYGAKDIISPNIDSVLKHSTVFFNSYCQYPICTPSRASMFIGLRPDETKVYGIHQNFRDVNDTLFTMQEYYKNNGYKSFGFGKVFQHWDKKSYNETKRVRKNSTNTKTKDYASDTNKVLYERFGTGLPYDRADVSDTIYIDGWLANRATEAIQSHNTEKPFFMAVGFFKPHLPFNSPKKYWDMYDPFLLDAAQQDAWPINSSSYFGNASVELTRYHGIATDGIVDGATARVLKHGYYASISYVDAQVGRLINALREKKILDKTIIVFWSDHGYKLGDFSEWTKFTLSNIDTKNLFFINHPDYPEFNAVNDIVESVDIFPTLTDFTNVPAPAHLSGRSLTKYVTQTDQDTSPGGSIAITQLLKTNIMGYALKTDKYSYNVWKDTVLNKILERELYFFESQSIEIENEYNQLTHESQQFLDSIYNEIIEKGNYDLVHTLRDEDLEIHKIAPVVSGGPLEPLQKVVIYPNPATSEIFITTDGLKTDCLFVSIYSIGGQIELETTVGENRGIDVSSLSGGLYFLSIKNSLGHKTVRRVHIL